MELWETYFSDNLRKISGKFWKIFQGLGGQPNGLYKFKFEE